MRNRIAAAFAANIIVIAIVTLGAFAWGYEGTLSVTGVAAASQRLFGGIGAAITWLVGGAVFIGLLLWHSRLVQRGARDAATALFGVTILVASFGAIRLLQQPTSELWALAGLIFISGGLTTLMRSIFTAGSVPGWARFRAWRAARAAAPAATSTP